MTPEERAKDICHRAGWTIEPWVYDIIVAAIQRAINDKLEECALAIEALEQGTYTTAQTPAGLVRAMKVRG